MPTDDEIIKKRLAIKAITYICPECDARIIFRNNADKHEHKTYRVTEFSEEELKTMLSEARADQFRKDTKEIFDKVDTMCIKYLVNTETVDINALNNFIEEYQELKKKYGVD